MNIAKANAQVRNSKWNRYRYNLTTPMGEDGRRITGCDKHIGLSRYAASEGMVLLENDGTLPLKEGTTVSFFGVGTLEFVIGGGGSGWVFPKYIHNPFEGISAKAPKIKIYEPITKFYYDKMLADPDVNKITHYFDEFECPEELVKEASENSDTAIIIIHRFSKEGIDRSEKEGDFLLTDAENKLVKDVTKYFKKVVAVLNVGGMIDVSWIKENKNIGAALLAWQPGMEGGMAIGDILCGDINPSGKLTDTFAKRFTDYPSSETFNESEEYVSYYEDIFVGYRYFETVPGAKEKVNYPFGYGLSYTKFDISKPVVEVDCDKIKVSVTVKNIGDFAGKEVVQCYFSAPQGKLTKSAISLVSFKKTKLLEKGESQDIFMEFKVSDMASYDDLGKCKKSAYILEGGEYKFFVGNNCRDIIEADYKYTVKDDFVVVKQLSQLCAPNKLEKRMLADGSFEELPSFSIKEYDIPEPVNNAKAPETEKPIQFESVFFEKISMDEFIAQMTDDELIDMLGGVPNRGVANVCGMGGNVRLGIPAFMTADGPAGLRISPPVGIATTAWPCATLLACTWDPDIIYEIGKAGAVECKENGIPIWLTPALNIHRNPLCGRNFEYFSEDPLISGIFAANKVKGIKSEKINCAIKHFACNNKEVNRSYSDSRVSERALREIYLKGFEICVKEAAPAIVMTAYNIINAVRCCENYELIQKILRDEWGFKGMVTSDWSAVCDQTVCVKVGNDIRMPIGKTEELKADLENGTLKRGHLELCVKRILSTFLEL